MPCDTTETQMQVGNEQAHTLLTLSLSSKDSKPPAQCALNALAYNHARCCDEHGTAGRQRHEAAAVVQLRLVASRLHLLHILEACDRPWSEQQLELLLTCGLEGGRGQRAPLPKKERWTNPARFTALTFEQGQKNLRVGFQRGQPKETNKLR